MGRHSKQRARKPCTPGCPGDLLDPDVRNQLCKICTQLVRKKESYHLKKGEAKRKHRMKEWITRLKKATEIGNMDQIRSLVAHNPIENDDFSSQPESETLIENEDSAQVIDSVQIQPMMEDRNDIGVLDRSQHFPQHSEAAQSTDISYSHTNEVQSPRFIESASIRLTDGESNFINDICEITRSPRGSDIEFGSSSTSTISTSNPRGIYNTHNNCLLSSLLQCIASLPLNFRSNYNNELSAQIISVIENIRLEGGVLDFSDLWNKLSTVFGIEFINGMELEDADPIMNHIMELSIGKWCNTTITACEKCVVSTETTQLYHQTYTVNLTSAEILKNLIIPNHKRCTICGGDVEILPKQPGSEQFIFPVRLSYNGEKVIFPLQDLIQVPMFENHDLSLAGMIIHDPNESEGNSFGHFSCIVKRGINWYSINGQKVQRYIRADTVMTRNVVVAFLVVSQRQSERITNVTPEAIHRFNSPELSILSPVNLSFIEDAVLIDDSSIPIFNQTSNIENQSEEQNIDRNFLLEGQVEEQNPESEYSPLGARLEPLQPRLLPQSKRICAESNFDFGTESYQQAQIQPNQGTRLQLETQAGFVRSATEIRNRRLLNPDFPLIIDDTGDLLLKLDKSCNLLKTDPKQRTANIVHRLFTILNTEGVLDGEIEKYWLSVRNLQRKVETIKSPDFEQASVAAVFSEPDRNSLVFRLLWLKVRYLISDKTIEKFLGYKRGIDHQIKGWIVIELFKHIKSIVLNEIPIIEKNLTTSEGGDVKCALIDIIALVKFLLKYVYSGENSGKLRVKFSGDGRQTSSNMHHTVFTICLIDLGGAFKAENVYTVAIYEAKEDYFLMKQVMDFLNPMFEKLVEEGILIKDEQSDDMASRNFSFLFYFVADWKFAALILGMNAAGSTYFCLWCCIRLKQTHEIHKSDAIGLRSLRNMKSYCDRCECSESHCGDLADCHHLSCEHESVHGFVRECLLLSKVFSMDRVFLDILHAILRTSDHVEREFAEYCLSLNDNDVTDKLKAEYFSKGRKWPLHRNSRDKLIIPGKWNANVRLQLLLNIDLAAIIKPPEEWENPDIGAVIDIWSKEIKNTNSNNATMRMVSSYFKKGDDENFELSEFDGPPDDEDFAEEDSLLTGARDNNLTARNSNCAASTSSVPSELEDEVAEMEDDDTSAAYSVEDFMDGEANLDCSADRYDKLSHWITIRKLLFEVLSYLSCDNENHQSCQCKIKTTDSYSIYTGLMKFLLTRIRAKPLTAYMHALNAHVPSQGNIKLFSTSGQELKNSVQSRIQQRATNFKNIPVQTMTHELVRIYIESFPEIFNFSWGRTCQKGFIIDLPLGSNLDLSQKNRDRLATRSSPERNSSLNEPNEEIREYLNQLVLDVDEDLPLVSTDTIELKSICFFQENFTFEWFQWKISIKKSLHRFSRVGDITYLSCLIQALFHIPSFSHSLLFNHPQDTQLSRVLLSIMCSLIRSPYVSRSPLLLLTYLDKIDRKYSSGPNSPTELLLLLISYFPNHLKKLFYGFHGKKLHCLGGHSIPEILETEFCLINITQKESLKEALRKRNDPNLNCPICNKQFIEEFAIPPTIFCINVETKELDDTFVVENIEVQSACNTISYKLCSFIVSKGKELYENFVTFGRDHNCWFMKENYSCKLTNLQTVKSQKPTILFYQQVKQS